MQHDRNNFDPYDQSLTELARELQRERTSAYRWVAVCVVLIGVIVIGVAMVRAL